MRKLIMDWLYGGTDEAAPATLAVYGNEARVYISRISNGFIVQHGGIYTYCQRAEDIAAVVVSLFAKQSLGGQQMELFLNQQLDKNVVPRGLVPNKHPYI